MANEKVTAIYIKVSLAIFLLMCLLKMPYGYYQFMRIAVSFLFGWLAYIEFNKKRNITAFFCGTFVILFQPIKKLAFNKQEWKSIDLFIAGGLILWMMFDVFVGVRKKQV